MARGTVNIGGSETTTSLGNMVYGATAKTAPADDDSFGLSDSAGSNVLKKFKWLDLKNVVATFTNKRITNRFTSASSGTTLTPNMSTSDSVFFYNIANGLTIAAPTGTPVSGDKLLIKLRDNGTARALTWDAIYKPNGVALPTTTVPNKAIYVGCIYDGVQYVKWDVIAVTQEA